MRGLPPPLLRKLRETLFDCGPFADERKLRAVFADERIAHWRNMIPGGSSAQERVDLFVDEFHRRRNAVGQNALVLFLQALHDQAIVEDECHQRLDDLAIALAAALGDQLPPLARQNLWRASAVRAGTEIPAGLGGYAPVAPEALPAAPIATLPAGLSPGRLAEQLEALKNKDKADWLPLDFLRQGVQAAHAVGRVEHQGRRIGTAFLVAPDLVLTNAHVVHEIPQLEQGGVRFHVELPAQAQWHYFAGVVVQSPVAELDFALVRLCEPAAGPPVTLADEDAYPGQPANILQFPGVAGGGMQVALRHNAIVHVDPTRIYYVTDTEGGSSGSPVFNDDWRVIALHRAGLVDDAQNPIENANQGVPLRSLAHLIRPYLEGGAS